MALNPNHTFEDLGEVKCAIVEKNCPPERAEFIQRLLEHNGFTVVVVKTPPPKPKAAAPPPKPVAAPPAADGTAPAPEVATTPVLPPTATPPPDTFTVGVTDLTFSPINAVFNRELKTLQGEIVTSAYWKELEATPKKEEWYWRK